MVGAALVVEVGLVERATARAPACGLASRASRRRAWPWELPHCA